jgi:hypothetical protein
MPEFLSPVQICQALAIGMQDIHGIQDVHVFAPGMRSHGAFPGIAAGSIENQDIHISGGQGA